MIGGAILVDGLGAFQFLKVEACPNNNMAVQVMPYHATGVSQPARVLGRNRVDSSRADSTVAQHTTTIGALTCSVVRVAGVM